MLLSLWHTFTDSDAFRLFQKRGPGRAIFRSRTFKEINVARNNVRSRAASRRHPQMFREVQMFCFFVGHNKSGASLLGGSLDAHPNVILSDEVDALQYVESGLGRDQIFHLMRKGSEAEARKGRVTARRLEPYSYWVPGQWQGRFEVPIVMGDSTTGTSTRRIRSNPDLLERLSVVMAGVDVKLIQVIRNPFDPISVMMVRGGRSFQNSIDHYFAACDTLVAIRSDVAPGALLPVRYEEFVADPVQGLARVCGFLGVAADPRYLNACGSIIRRTPDRSRDLVDWTQPWIDLVHERMSAFDFLRGYRYEH
jgi:Sulfotransferase family